MEEKDKIVTALAVRHPPAHSTVGERVLSRVTLGQVLLGTLLVGMTAGAGIGLMLTDAEPERVVPSIVVGFDEASLPVMQPKMPLIPLEEHCQSGAFLGIEFRIDRSFAHWIHAARRGEFDDRHFRQAVEDGETGVHVLDVLHGSTAESMGLEAGDVIVEMDGEAIRSTAQLASEIRSRCVGEITTIRIHRGAKSRLLTGALGQRFSHHCGR